MKTRTHDEAFRDYEARIRELDRAHQARLQRIARTERGAKLLLILLVVAPILIAIIKSA